MFFPALLRQFEKAKVYQAKEVVVWGTGDPRREPLHVDNLADADLMNLDKISHYRCVKSMQSHVNIGFCSNLTIAKLVEVIRFDVGLIVGNKI